MSVAYKIGNEIRKCNLRIRGVCGGTYVIEEVMTAKRLEYASVLTTRKTERKPIAFNEISCGINDEETRIMLHELINEYRDVIGREISEIGLTREIEMNIELTTDEPIVSRPYRIPEPKKKIVLRMINELLVNDIITKSTSTYASSIVLVKKKNGQDRLCVDYVN